MTFEELLEKYQAVLRENSILKEEINNLNTKLGVQTIKIVKANMLFILKTGISHRALNHLKRLAAFNNPEFYKAQAMRMPIYKNKIPRIISCSDETEDYLCLPRGCEADVRAFFAELKIEPEVIDETNHGRSIDVEFKGNLRDEQPQALDKLLKHDNGVLSGTTAFGKTVVAIKLIAERNVNTLIIVDKVNLVTQWKKRLTEFLTINEVLPERIEDKKRGRKKANSAIGQLGAGKDNLSGIIDIAVMQSLNRMGEVKDCVKNYGMIIVDEAHHVVASTYQRIVKAFGCLRPRGCRLLGLTATGIRGDHVALGHVYQDIVYQRTLGDMIMADYIADFKWLRVNTDVQLVDLRSGQASDFDSEELEPLVNTVNRNRLIVEAYLKYGENRKTLCFATSVNHAISLAKEFRRAGIRAAHIHGKMSSKARKQVLDEFKKGLIEVLTNFNLLIEGYDQPDIRCLIMGRPTRSWRCTCRCSGGGRENVKVRPIV